MRKIVLSLSLLFTITAFTQCSDLFFSEYIEGSGNNKALEIYNPTDATIDLTDYVVYRNNNGAITPTDSLFLIGDLVPNAVFVIGNSSASFILTEASDTLHTMTFYNGDDAIWLKKISTGDTLDIIGEIGTDPGSGWTVGSGATNNTTLVRDILVQGGQLDWSLGATEWMVFPIDMLDSLGEHNMIACESCEETISYFAVEICYNYVPEGTTDTLTSSGLYTDTLINIAGCDSIRNIDLTILEETGSFTTLSVCDSYESPDGMETWTESGVYFDTIPNAAGCDSIIATNLTVFYSSSAILDIVACKNFTSPSGQIWNSSGTYLDTIPNGVGCDSLITFNLTILNLDVLVTQVGATITADNAGAFYQWLDCDNDFAVISGESDQSFTATENGSYAVEIFQDGCTDTSVCKTVDNIGLENWKIDNEIEIYPNPTLNDVTVAWLISTPVKAIHVYNIYGELIWSNSVNGVTQIKVPLTIESGCYIVEVETLTGELMHYPVIKQ